MSSKFVIHTMQPSPDLLTFSKGEFTTPIPRKTPKKKDLVETLQLCFEEKTVHGFLLEGKFCVYDMEISGEASFIKRNSALHALLKDCELERIVPAYVTEVQGDKALKKAKGMFEKQRVVVLDHRGRKLK